jgi:hypothetical protein
LIRKYCFNHWFIKMWHVLRLYFGSCLKLNKSIREATSYSHNICPNQQFKRPSIIFIISLLLVIFKLCWFSLTVEFNNKRPNTQIVIVIVSKLAKKVTKNNSKYIMKCVILSLKSKKLFAPWARFLVQAHPAYFCKNTSKEKNSITPL